MELEYESLKNELLRALDATKIWILASSDGARVSARSMSIIHDGLAIYFQTGKELDKYGQIIQNENVALCHANISIEGIARDVGSWEDNPAAKALYLQHHQGSYDLYGNLPGQVVIQVTPQRAIFWKYIDGEPMRDFLYIAEKRAERRLYFEQFPRKAPQI